MRSSESDIAKAHRLVAYIYYSAPWEMKSGDDVRVHTILSLLATQHRVIAFHLTTGHEQYKTTVSNNVIYVAVPRKFYRMASRFLRWRWHQDLNPLMKVTHYIDEFLAAVKISNEIKRADVALVIGAMTIAPFLLQILGVRTKIIYDPLANYAQTLYLRARTSLREVIKYGVYLMLHKLQIKTSTTVIYPSAVDQTTAQAMFKPRNTSVITNPSPVCYDSIEEYNKLRGRRRDYTKPYFVLLAGGRGKSNEEAVRHTIRVFSEITDGFLFITGPWNDYNKAIKSDNIKILGTVPHRELKELLAVADYGLSPIFSHAAGTFMKMLAYQAADLNIIASPHSILGLDLNPRKVRIIHSYDEYAQAVREAVQNYEPHQQRRPLTCKERDEALQAQISQALRQFL